MVPGLYSWWVDDQGAADLSRGLGLPVPGGLIYAGQAGATRWPSGKRSQGTLWGRITGMHLGGAAEFSTFRRILSAILRPVLGLDAEDDPKLSAWISTRLGVNAVPVPTRTAWPRLRQQSLTCLIRRSTCADGRPPRSVPGWQNCAAAARPTRPAQRCRYRHPRISNQMTQIRTRATRSLPIRNAA